MTSTGPHHALGAGSPLQACRCSDSIHWAQIHKGTAYEAYNMQIWQLHGAAVRAYDKFFG